MDGSADATIVGEIAKLFREMAKALDRTIDKLGRPKQYGSERGRRETRKHLRMAKAMRRAVNRPEKFVATINYIWDRIAEKRFAETKNPLFAWYVFHRSNQLNRAQPAWVTDYFNRTSADLIAKATIGKSPTDREMKKSLGLISNTRVKGLRGRGRSTAFTQFAREWRDLALALMVECVMRLRPKWQIEDAISYLRTQWMVPCSETIIKYAHQRYSNSINMSDV